MISNSLTTWFLTNLNWLVPGVLIPPVAFFAKRLLERPRAKAMVVSAGSPGDAGHRGLSMAAGAAMVGSAVALGDNNTQNITVTVKSEAAFRQPRIKDRRPSVPTGNQLRQQQYDLPPLQQEHFIQQFVGIKIAWPARIRDVRKLDELRCVVEMTYGEESWGASISCSVPLQDYPILRAVKPGHWVWVEGRVNRIEHSFWIAEPRLDFE